MQNFFSIKFSLNIELCIVHICIKCIERLKLQVIFQSEHYSDQPHMRNGETYSYFTIFRMCFWNFFFSYNITYAGNFVYSDIGCVNLWIYMCGCHLLGITFHNSFRTFHRKLHFLYVLIVLMNFALEVTSTEYNGSPLLY